MEDDQSYDFKNIIEKMATKMAFFTSNTAT
jgi:hypothetical protein